MIGVIFFEGIFISFGFVGIWLPRLPWMSQEPCQTDMAAGLSMAEKLKTPDFKEFLAGLGFGSLHASFQADFENRNAILSKFEFRQRISLKPGENLQFLAGMPFAPVQATWRYEK
ncbi:MAG: hypothetical protein ABJM26_19920 [Anderseniella sp.]